MDMDTDMNMNMDMDVDMDMDMGFSSNNPVTFGRFLKAYYRERKHSSNRPPVTINLKGATHLTRKHFFFTITYAVKFKRAGLWKNEKEDSAGDNNRNTYRLIPANPPPNILPDSLFKA